MTMAVRSGRLVVRLAVVFAAIAALTAALAGVLITATLDARFESYVQQNLQGRADDTAAVLAQVYAQAGTWDAVRYVDLGRFGVSMSGFRISLYDAQGALLASSSGQQGGLLFRQEPLAEEGPSASAQVVVDGVKVGEVRVSSLLPGGFLTDRDIAFRNGAFAGLLSAAVIAVIAASIAGALFARSIARPVEHVTSVAASIRGGDLAARTGMIGEDPVKALGRTLDEMAASIEAERESERRLTADVAHELRTPLQAIQATVEAMQDGVLPADAQRLGTVLDETRRLSRLTESLLELSRLERASVPMRAEPLDLSLPARAAIDSHRALFEAAGLSLAEHVAEGITIAGDPDRLQQAIGNLLSNAARYTPAGGSVSVTVAAEGDSGVVRVRDTGIGIADEHREQVFARFWRADPSRESAKGGVGIGLAVVKEIVERHGGTIAIDSGEWGTEFAVRLPLVDPIRGGVRS
ncbi:MAG: sensor histidine kinase [Coriobacteriaceae bacterium]|nr:sensor histidine kinase [Coriobacteriaceae bacterium]